MEMNKGALLRGMREGAMTARAVNQIGYAELLEAGVAEIEALRAVLHRVAHEAPEHFAWKSAAKAVLLDD